MTWAERTIPINKYIRKDSPRKGRMSSEHGHGGADEKSLGLVHSAVLLRESAPRETAADRRLAGHWELAALLCLLKNRIISRS